MMKQKTWFLTTWYVTFGICVGAFFPLLIHGIETIQIASIKCENKVDPLGVPLKTLHFGWTMVSNVRNQMQTAYRLVVSSSQSSFESGTYDIWDSGRIQSSNNFFVPYDGDKLHPGARYFWRVRVWDKDGQKSPWSDTGTFVTGLFNDTDWSGARWIGYEELPDTLTVVPGVHGNGNQLGEKGQRRPVTPYFRNEFHIAKPVDHALLFISGLGHYEASVNGETIGERFLAPGWTEYNKTCLYNTFDITGLLVNGDNAICAIVGNGFYHVNRERYRKLVIAYGMPKLIAKLQIMYTDGSVDEVVTNEQWKTSPSPITYTSIYGGEDYDARLEQRGWNTAGFDDKDWNNAIHVKPPKGVLTPEIDYPLRIKERFEVNTIHKLKDGVYLYDFGQNASGIVELKVQGKAGQEIRLVPAELITKDRLANQNASGKPYYFNYTLKGRGVEIWRPQFTYYGFRYAQVEGAEPDNEKDATGLPQIKSLSLLHTRNSTPQVGSFECSNALFNRIDSLINWAIKSNLQSVITDCPHREKLGWLEQTHLMGAAIHYNFDLFNLYKQLVLDMMDSQLENGLVPDIAPEYVEFEGGFRDSPEWGSAAVILPWLLYKWYGDHLILEQAWPMMKRYVDYLGTMADAHIVSHGLGDWYDLGPQFPGEAQLTPKALTATAIYYYDITLLAQIADVLHNPGESKRLNDLARIVKDAFNDRFFDKNTKVYSTGSQTAMAMPLCVGLVDTEDRETVMANLLQSISASNNALTAGDVGFHYLVKALNDGGASEIMYTMINRNDVPGYGYQLEKGATALTESWAALEQVSNNHLMLGHVMEWFYSGLAGIRQAEDSAAYRSIIIEPNPAGDITWAKSHYDSPHGRIISEWRIKEDRLHLDVEIPVNTTAKICMPDTTYETVTESGKVIDKNSLIKINRTKKGDWQIDIGSGAYEFMFQ